MPESYLEKFAVALEREKKVCKCVRERKKNLALNSQ
jgi:hypothetical protein